MADTAEAAKNMKKAGEYYIKAYETFIDLGMEESAATIQPKVMQARKRLENEPSNY